jgi:RHS repeat-associated protein
VQLDGRTISMDSYRYGFNGMEKDDEVKGEGNSVNFSYRMHDPRVGRFFAVDPLTAEYVELSPYQVSSNRMIDFVEVEGLEGTKAQFYATIGVSFTLSKSSNFSISATLSLTTQTKLTKTSISSEFSAKGKVNFQLNSSPEGFYSFGGMLGLGNNSNQAGVFTSGNSNGNNYIASDFRPSLGFGSAYEKSIDGNNFKGVGVSSLTSFGRNEKTSLQINGRMDIGGVNFNDDYTLNSSGNFFDISRKTNESTLSFSYSVKSQNFGLNYGLMSSNTTISSFGDGIYPSTIGGNTTNKTGLQIGGSFSFKNGFENANASVLIGGSKNPLSTKLSGGLQSASVNFNNKGKAKGLSFQTGAGVSSNKNGQKIY